MATKFSCAGETKWCRCSLIFIRLERGRPKIPIESLRHTLPLVIKIVDRRTPKKIDAVYLKECEGTCWQTGLAGEKKPLIGEPDRRLGVRKQTHRGLRLTRRQLPRFMAEGNAEFATNYASTSAFEPTALSSSTLNGMDGG